MPTNITRAITLLQICCTIQFRSVIPGGEFQYGRRVNLRDGFNVNDYRLQFSFKYDWKKGFTF